MTEKTDAVAAWKAWADDVERRSEHRWAQLYAALAPSMVEALAKVASKAHVACPFPGHESKNFRVLPDFNHRGHVICTCTENRSLRGVSVLMRLNSWRYTDAINAVADVLGCARSNARVPVALAPAAPAVPVSSEEDGLRDAQHAESLIRLWDRTVPLTHASAEPARAYLRHRKLLPQKGPLANVRFVSSLVHVSDEGVRTTHPAIVSLLHNGKGERLNLHRTYLTALGRKAPVEKAKKLMSRPSSQSSEGMAIRLDVPSRLLNYAEGLESTLAVRLITDAPSWAAVAAAGLRNLVVPDGVDVVLIWADHDRSGEGLRSADVALARVRAQGKRGAIVPPPFAIPAGEKTLDWADVVNQLGIEEVRKLSFFSRLARQLQQENLAVPALIAQRC